MWFSVSYLEEKKSLTMNASKSFKQSNPAESRSKKFNNRMCILTPCCLSVATKKNLEK